MKTYLLVLFQLFASINLLIAEEIQTISPDGNVTIHFDLGSVIP